MAKIAMRVLRRIIYGLLVAVGVTVLGMVLFVGWWMWETSKAIHRLDYSVEESWKKFTRWDLLDAAIRTYGDKQIDADSLNLPIPVCGPYHSSSITKDSYSVEYGGGLHHVGVVYFLDPKKAELIECEGGVSRKLTPHLVFYHE